jgi:hypothetical protein
MRPAFLFLLALLAPLVVAGAAMAQPVQPLDRLLPQVRRTHPGHFYDADGPHPGPGGSQHYHLKWMTPDGRIVWYDTDARTGRVLGVSPGRDSFDARGEGHFGGRGYYGPHRDYRGSFGGPRRGHESRGGGFGRGFGGGRHGGHGRH